MIYITCCVTPFVYTLQSIDNYSVRKITIFRQTLLLSLRKRTLIKIEHSIYDIAYIQQYKSRKQIFRSKSLKISSTVVLPTIYWDENSVLFIGPATRSLCSNILNILYYYIYEVWNRR